MALVSYSESEASDSEQEDVAKSQEEKPDPTPPTPAANPPKQPSSANFPSLVDRSNPRKIRVALPEIKPESAADGEQEGEDGPARKKAKLGGGRAFSGFNAFLPAPKRATATADKDKESAGPARKVFSLKTGATPGFDRGADTEMRQDQGFDADDGGDEGDIPKAGSLRTEDSGETEVADKPKEEGKGEPKLKGNAMMFKPLSVGRNSQQKKKPPKTTTSALPAADELRAAPQKPRQQPQQAPAQAAPPPKPKISLFSISSEDDSVTTPSNEPAQGTSYQPLVYNPTPNAPPAGPEPEPSTSIPADTYAQQQPQTLDNIADDLNLSRAQRRHLFGRHADTSKSRVLNFDTETEYVANQEMAQQTDLAATQHNPVRAIAPGKHTLQQLVNAASNQREALEESFAAGRRNKKEAGSKYGW